MEQVRNEQIIYSAAVYCRHGKDDEQAGESVSIKTHKMMPTDYCHEQQIKLNRSFILISDPTGLTYGYLFKELSYLSRMGLGYVYRPELLY